MKKKDIPAVHANQVWERRDGTTFTIHRVYRGRAQYWLAAGSRPQFRSIALENFKRYTLKHERNPNF